MNDLIASVTDLTAKDPLLLLAGAVALVIVLVALYHGAWVLVTHLFVFAVIRSLYMTAGIGGMFMLWLFAQAVVGPVQERGTNFLWATILAACEVFIFYLLSTDNFIVRFAKKLTVDGELPE